MNDPREIDTRRTRAAIRHSRWPGWIWAVPIAAVLLIGWWGFRSLTTEGEDVTIRFDNVHGLKESNTNVVYRGMNVGKVSDIALASDGRSVNVTVNIEKDATKFLKAGTQFWLRGANPNISDPASLSALLSGPTIVMEPGPGKKTTHFVGLTQKPVVTGAHGPPQIYGVSFTGPVGELKPGEAVKLRGFEVGQVKDIGFHYDAATGAIVTPVTLALYPALFHIDDTAGTAGGATQASDKAIASLIRKGLSAKLERDPPLIGAPRVTLEIAPGAAGKPLAVVDGVPQIPAAPDSGIGSIVERINKLPIEEIGQNVRDATQHVDTLVSSAQLGDAVTQLDASLKQLHQVMTGAGPEIPKLLAQLRGAAGEIESAAKAAASTARAADQVVGGTASQNSIKDAVRELTGAARSVRNLASYLDRHPEALVQGRSAR